MEKEVIVPFRIKLQHELFHGFSKIVAIISVSTTLMMTIFVISVQYGRLMQGKALVTQQFQMVQTGSLEMFSNLEKRGVVDFLQNNIEEREMYRVVYEESHQLSFRTAFSLYDSNFSLQLSTRMPNRDGLKDDSFVKIALQNLDLKPKFKVTRDNQGNRFLLHLIPIIVKGEVIGYGVLYIDSNDFESSTVSESADYMIADEFDNLFTTNNVSYRSENLQKVESSFFDHLFIVEKGALYLTDVQDLTDGLCLYTSVYAFPIPYLLLFVGIFIGLFLLILLILARNLTRKITLHSSDAIDVLVSDLEAIMTGFQQHVSVQTDDEFGFLAQKMNQLIDNLQKLFHQTLRLEREKTQLERKMLEAQFNPHFLYNALESIKILMYVDPEQAEQMILAMNRVLRYSVATQEESSYLADDLSVLEDFLEVNRMRFGQLDYQIDFPESLSNLRVPHLFLLPLVENSLKYGMAVRHDLVIRIRILESDSKVLFQVIDNGPGFSESFKTSFSQYLQQQSTEHGMVNSYRRLNLLYSSAQIAVLESAEGHIVQLSIEKRQVCTDS